MILPALLNVIKGQFLRFGIIGFTALSIHLMSVMALVSILKVPPLGANILGFLLAFQVSYWGHYTWTFNAGHIPHKMAMSRFFAVALFSFVLNEGLYAGLLYNTPLPYDGALLMVLIFISAVTFMLSEFWAFR